MKIVTVENDRVVVNVDGAVIRHSLETIQKAEQKLRADLGMWLGYEKRLLTQRAADLGCTCAYIIQSLEVIRVDEAYCPHHHPSR